MSPGRPPPPLRRRVPAAPDRSVRCRVSVLRPGDLCRWVLGQRAGTGPPGGMLGQRAGIGPPGGALGQRAGIGPPGGVLDQPAGTGSPVRRTRISFGRAAPCRPAGQRWRSPRPPPPGTAAAGTPRRWKPAGTGRKRQRRLRHRHVGADGQHGGLESEERGTPPERRTRRWRAEHRPPTASRRPLRRAPRRPSSPRNTRTRELSGFHAGNLLGAKR